MERLLAALDAMDGDPEAEPILGAPESDPGWERPQADWIAGADDDRELDVDIEEADELDHGERCYDDSPCPSLLPGGWMRGL